jgi:hypothetical protein
MPCIELPRSSIYTVTGNSSNDSSCLQAIMHGNLDRDPFLEFIAVPDSQEQKHVESNKLHGALKTDEIRLCSEVLTYDGLLPLLLERAACDRLPRPQVLSLLSFGPFHSHRRLLDASGLDANTIKLWDARCPIGYAAASLDSCSRFKASDPMMSKRYRVCCTTLTTTGK